MLLKREKNKMIVEKIQEITYEYNPYPTKYIIKIGDESYEFLLLYGLSATCPECEIETKATVTEYLCGEVIRQFIYCRNCDRVYEYCDIDVYMSLPENVKKYMPDFSNAARWLSNYV